MVYETFMAVMAIIGAITMGIFSIILSAFVMMPISPFTTQNVTLGVLLLVSTMCGVTPLVGALIGGIIGGILGIPCLLCNKNEKEETSVDTSNNQALYNGDCWVYALD